MRTLGIAFFSISALLSAPLLPNKMNVIPLLVLSGARAIALAAALLFWVASGRVDAWGSSRHMLALTTMVGVVAVTGGCFFIQTLRDDEVTAPWPMIYRVTAGLLPILLAASVFLPSRKLFLIVAAVAPVAAVLLISTWSALNVKFHASIPTSKDQRARAELLVQRRSELERISLTAGLEPLLEFVNPGEPDEVKSSALMRMEKTPDWIAQLSAMLEGGHRLNALYVLSRRVDRLPATVAERCWGAVAASASDQMERLKQGSVPAELDEQVLLDSAEAMGNQSSSSRELHWSPLAAVSEFLKAAKAPLNTAILDSWVRTSQLQRVPENAGIEPLLEFTGPGEASDLREGALARIGKVPESTAKLAKLLDGPHRLDALVVLAQRADQLREDLLEQCLRTSGLIAKDMAKKIERGDPPKRADVRKLSSAVGLVWVKLGPVRDRHLGDLASVRDVVRVAADEWDKAAFAWADKVLVRATPAQSAGERK